MKKEIGVFRTESASKYLQQLCKHFAHKVEVDYDPQNGFAALPPGPANMIATDEELRVEISGETEQALLIARSIIDKHLVRFAFREDFEAMDWKPGSF